MIVTITMFMKLLLISLSLDFSIFEAEWVEGPVPRSGLASFLAKQLCGMWHRLGNLAALLLQWSA